MIQLHLLLVLVLYCATTGSCYRFVISSQYPPFLRRASQEILQWDTGDLARILALSDGVVVNHQGVWLLNNNLHVTVAQTYASQSMECDEWKNALCALPSQNGVVFASAGSVFVPSNTSSIQLNALQSYAGTSCQGNNVGVGRQITENVQYDISACDIGSMDKSFLLHGGYLYIVDAPYPAWIHLLLCVSTVFTLSGMLYILRPKETESSENVSEAFHDDNTLVQSKTLDGVMVNAILSIVTVMSFQIVHSTFVTIEDLMGFLITSISFFFYIVSVSLHCLSTCNGQYSQKKHALTFFSSQVIVIRYLKGKHAPGVFIDMCTSCISIVFISSYSSLDHPFINVIYAVMVFRQWNKIIRFTYGNTKNPIPT